MHIPREEEEAEEAPIRYAIDHLVLMHRDAHFSGNFEFMLDYYRKNGKGVSREFSISRIEDLYKLQIKTGKDLAAYMLSGAEAEKVSHSKKIYKKLRDLYAVKNPKSKHPVLIANLILSEDSDAASEVQAIVAEKGSIVPALIEVIANEDFYDPLNPGYGLAPALAAKCLGLIGDKRAIIALFEAIGQGDFFDDDMLLDALHAIGEPAKQFLLKVLNTRPVNRDNEQAAIALVNFKEDTEVSTACLNLLQHIRLKDNEPLATYLVLTCEGLSDPIQRKRLLQIARNDSTPKVIQQDILAISKEWQEKA